MFDLSFAKKNFSLDDYVYLNASYMGPISNGTKVAGEHGIYTKLNPLRITADHFFSHIGDIREQASRILNGKQHNIAIIPSVSYGMATIAANVDFRRGQNIVLVKDEMPSNVYVWQEAAKQHDVEIRMIGPDSSVDMGRMGSSWNKNIINAIDKNTALVSIANVHWMSSVFFDLLPIREKTQEVSALLIIDGTQSVGALPLDVDLLKPDAVVVAAYKWLLGPYSIGFMHVGDKLLEGRPLENHWLNRNDSHCFELLTNYCPDYQAGANRFDVGEASNFILAPMLSNALREIANWGVDNIYAHCSTFTASLEVGVQRLGIPSLPAGQRAGHFLSIDIGSTTKALQICNFLKERKIVTSVRGESIRVTPHVYNQLEQAAYFLELLEAGLQSTL